jgi:hypothetical protein
MATATTLSIEERCLSLVESLARYSGDDRATAFDNFEQEAYQIALDAGWIEPNHPLITLTRVRK